MRTMSIFCSTDIVALACGAPGHVISASFAADPIEPVIARLTELLDAYRPERFFLTGEGAAATNVGNWLVSQGHTVKCLPDGAVEQMVEALEAGATQPEFFEVGERLPGEVAAIAALEVVQRLTHWPADRLVGRRVYR